MDSNMQTVLLEQKRCALEDETKGMKGSQMDRTRTHAILQVPNQLL